MIEGWQVDRKQIWSSPQRQELERIARAGTSEKRMVFRARLILECATGADNVQVAQTLGTSQQTVTLWRGRFLREGMGGLAELARSGRPERIKPSLMGNNITWNQNATSGMPTAKKFSTKYTEHGKRPYIPPIIKAI
jgi:Winged helix-turn helix